MIAEAPPRHGIEIIRKDAWVPDDFARRLSRWHPKSGLGAVARDIICSGRLSPDQARDLFDRVRSVVVVESTLSIVLFHGPNSLLHGGPRIERLGVVSRKLVTDLGVALIVDTFDNTVTAGDCRYHGIGTGTNAENQTDSALQTELTTQYIVNSTRATGTFSQPAANQSRSVATNEVDATVAITEHAPFSAAAVASGVCLDRSVFAAVNMVATDTLQTTYTLTVAAGG